MVVDPTVFKNLIAYTEMLRDHLGEDHLIVDKIDETLTAAKLQD